MDPKLGQLDDGGVSRRVFLKRAGTIGWTTPLILSALATPAFATHVPVGNACNATTQHCVATATGPGGTALPVICCVTGANAGKCGWPSGTVTAVSGPANCAGCCTGACGSGGLNRTCT